MNKECIVCNKKKDFTSRLFRFHTCQKCRDLAANGYHAMEIREFAENNMEVKRL